MAGLVGSSRTRSDTRSLHWLGAGAQEHHKSDRHLVYFYMFQEEDRFVIGVGGKIVASIAISEEGDNS